MQIERNIMTEEEIMERELESRKKNKNKILSKNSKTKKKDNPKKEKKIKVEKTEEELLQIYGNATIRKFQTRGHASDNIGKKEGTEVNKDLWLDTDFFFCVVFESSEQKYRFMEQAEEMIRNFTTHKDFELDEEFGEKVQIVNGVKLAEALGVKVSREQSREYPYGDLALRPYVLDMESF